MRFEEVSLVIADVIGIFYLYFIFLGLAIVVVAVALMQMAVCPSKVSTATNPNPLNIPFTIPLRRYSNAHDMMHVLPDAATGDRHDVPHRPHRRQLPRLRGGRGKLRPRTHRRPEPLQRQLPVLGLGLGRLISW